MHPPDSWARLPIPSPRDKTQSLLDPHSLFQQLLGFSAVPEENFLAIVAAGRVGNTCQWG